MLVQYQKTLHDLRATATRVQEIRRRRAAPKRSAWDLHSPPAPAAPKMTRSETARLKQRSSISTEPMDVDQQGARPTKNSIAASLDMEKRLPAWAKKPEPSSRYCRNADRILSRASAHISNCNRFAARSRTARSGTARRSSTTARSGSVKDKGTHPNSIQFSVWWGSSND
jgi:hypothetical protein